MKRKIVIIALIIFACIFTSSCGGSKYKENITSFVNDNQQLLLKVNAEFKKMKFKDFTVISTTEKVPLSRNSINYPKDISGLYIDNVTGTNQFVKLKNDIFSQILAKDCVMEIASDIKDKPYVVSYESYETYNANGKLTKMYGFYYSEDNLPHGWYGMDDFKKQMGIGWTFGNGSFYTEKIIDHWFYYEVSN
ncbi:MAG: hypothetical protein GYA50_08110 [Eubacteriaceae bacterium]|nr:hypothetical protein [Eubacteriaceae bacterium]